MAEGAFPGVLETDVCVVQILLFRDEFGVHLDRFSWLLEGDSVARFRALGPGYAFWVENEFTGRRVSPCRASSHPSGATACDDG